MDFIMPLNKLDSMQGVFSLDRFPDTLEGFLTEIEAQYHMSQKIIYLHQIRNVMRPSFESDDTDEEIIESMRTYRGNLDSAVLEQETPEFYDIKSATKYIVETYEKNKYMHRVLNEGKKLASLVGSCSDSPQEIKELWELIGSGIVYDKPNFLSKKRFMFSNQNKSIEAAQAIDKFLSTYYTV